MSEASTGFTDDQKNYLQGFMMGADVARKVRGLPVLSDVAGGSTGTTVQIGGVPAEPALTGPDALSWEAQNKTLAAGKKLCREEQAKRDKNGLDVWDDLRDHSQRGEFPAGTDVFLFKFQGLFYVSPAQEGYMCRLRIPGGVLNSHQFRGCADLAENYAGGYADITTRANLQFREIGPCDGIKVLEGLQDLGLVIRGSGADNVRNVTANPTSGIDPQELIETLPLAKEMHNYILHHRELYGLPRKFNIAFEGRGAVASLEDTNDIGFTAVVVTAEQATEAVPAGVYFRLSLGGITGHLDFARDTGYLVAAEECVPVAAAILKVFIAHGDRTDRKKARLKYVLDAWGFEKFIAETEKLLPQPLRKFPLDLCQTGQRFDRAGHLGLHRQKQPGLNYIGVVVPVGRLLPTQMRGLADLAERYGDRSIRLTVWQNLLLSGIQDVDVPTVQAEIEKLGLHWQASAIRSGLIACTGNAGCKYASSNTKLHAVQIADYLDERIELNQPINIHLTGCPHSCAQHYIGDIGLIATKVEVHEDEEMVEGYHLFVGGGYGEYQGIGREIRKSIPHYEVGPAIERLLRHYLEQKKSSETSFVEFTRSREVQELSQIASGDLITTQ